MSSDEEREGPASVRGEFDVFLSAEEETDRSTEPDNTGLCCLGVRGSKGSDFSKLKGSCVESLSSVARERDMH